MRTRTEMRVAWRTWVASTVAALLLAECRSFGTLITERSVAEEPEAGTRGDASQTEGRLDAAPDSTAGQTGTGGTADASPSPPAPAEPDAALLHDASVRDASQDGSGHVAPQPRCDPTSPFESPTDLTAVNDQMQSAQGAFVDGNTIYFAGRKVVNGDYDIYAAIGDPNTDSFPLAHVVPNLNTTNDEQGPILSSDGLTVTFGSRLPGATYHIYYAKRASRADDFGKPQLAWNLNSSTYDAVDSTSADGRTIYIETQRGDGGDGDIYRATTGASGVFGEPTPVDELDTAYDDGAAIISWDELSVYFVTNRDAGDGSYNIWMAHRPNTDAPFADLHPLDELNTPAFEAPTSISPDECTLYIARAISGSNYHVFVARRRPVAGP